MIFSLHLTALDALAHLFCLRAMIRGERGVS